MFFVIKLHILVIILFVLFLFVYFHEISKSYDFLANLALYINISFKKKNWGRYFLPHEL